MRWLALGTAAATFMVVFVACDTTRDTPPSSAAGTPAQTRSTTIGGPSAGPTRALPARGYGTGRLRNTHFAVRPVVMFGSNADENGSYHGYSVYARLTRDLPRRKNGMVAADFSVNGVGAVGDPVVRFSAPLHCFLQSSIVSEEDVPKIPLRPRARVTVTVTSTGLGGRPTGTLSTTTRTRPGMKSGPHDFTNPFEEAIGC